jgi:hypothetical protein
MRKSLPIICSLILITTVSNAQIAEGSVFLGGDLAAGTQKTKSEINTTYKSTSLTISPAFGKFIKENLVLGISPGYGYSNSKNDLGFKIKSTLYHGTVFIRKYKNIGASGFYIFGQSGVEAGYSKQSTENPSGTDEVIKRSSVGINAFPGISFEVSKKFHLETGFNDLLTISYNHEKRESNNPAYVGYKTNGFNLATSLSNSTSAFYLGFRVLLSK